MCSAQLNEWTEARKTGRWFGIPVPYHPGEEDLSILLAREQEQPETTSDEHIQVEAEAAREAEDASCPPPTDSTGRVEEVGVQPLPEGVEDVKPPVQGALWRVGVEPVRDDEVEDVREVERRERLRLWELEQGTKERERQQQRDREDMRLMVSKAMTSIHK